MYASKISYKKQLPCSYFAKSIVLFVCNLKKNVSQNLVHYVKKKRYCCKNILTFTFVCSKRKRIQKQKFIQSSYFYKEFDILIVKQLLDFYSH